MKLVNVLDIPVKIWTFYGSPIAFDHKPLTTGHKGDGYDNFCLEFKRYTKRQRFSFEKTELF